MLSVILVDDEQWTLRGLEQIVDWNSEGFQIVGSFLSADDVLEKVENGLRADLVISDIRLGAVTGLELIERLRLLLPQAKYALISGYTEFAYAQQALRLSVTEYLVKPVEEAVLLQFLRKVKRELIMQHSQSSVHPPIEPLLAKLYELGEDQSQFPGAEDFFAAAPGRWLTTVVSWHPLSLSQKNFPVPVSIRNFCAERDKAVCILSHTQQNRQLVTDSLVKAGFSEFCGVSQGPAGYRQVSQLLTQAIDAYNMYAFYHEPHVHLYRQDSPQTARQFMESFNQYFERKKYAAIYHLIDDILDHAVNHFYDAGLLLTFHNHVANSINLQGEMEPEQSKIPLYATTSSMIEKCSSLRKGLSFLQKQIQVMAQNSPEADDIQSSAKDIIPQIQEYIHNNYQSEISLSILSKKFLISEKYLSSLFKEVTDQNLTTYLNTVRIEKAKLLLANSNLIVQNVAYLCGYNDYFYFTKVFKRFVGTTPTTYRRQCQAGGNAL